MGVEAKSRRAELGRAGRILVGGQGLRMLAAQGAGRVGPRFLRKGSLWAPAWTPGFPSEGQLLCVT